jgi:MoaA/NifB/PqqE/SkfB family radical SAM enzyme
MELPAGFTSREQYSFPNILNVCIFKGSCPARCIHCPLGKTDPKERKQRFGDSSMTLELFKKIADEVACFRHSTLRIHAVGEPVLWPDLIDAVNYSHSKNALSWIFTNAITQKKALLEVIVSKCNIVEVSINSYDKDDYKRTKGVDAYEIVRENIIHMSEYIKRNNLKTRLLISRVESDDKAYDAGFLSYWKSRKVAADVFIRSYHSYNNIIEDKLKRGKVAACNVHWSRFNIDTNGDVVLCYNELFRGKDMDKSLILGNINDSTIREIWHSDRLTTIRKSQIMNQPGLITFTENLPCFNCYYCQPLGSNNPKSECQVEQLN